MDRGSEGDARRTAEDADPIPSRYRFLAGALSIGVHLAGLAALLWLSVAPSQPQREPPPMVVSLTMTPTPPGPPKPEVDQPGGPPEVSLVQPALPRATLPVVVVAENDAAPDANVLSESQLSGAVRAGEGGAGGGGCDMALLVQQALRRDQLVHAAVADARLAGRAILLWNGDWVRSGGQDGKGLAAVREAVMWEIGFAPAACRETRMHGLVLVSLSPGDTRFAIGASDWRWSDLLGLRRDPPMRREE